MAVAGDGQPRSERRARTCKLCLRVTAAEKARVARQAREAGYTSVAAWIYDSLQPSGGLSRREQGQVLFWIARISEVLRDLCTQIDLNQHANLIAPLSELQADMSAVHDILIGSAVRAGQNHSGA